MAVEIWTLSRMSDPKLGKIRKGLDDLLAVINDKSDTFQEQVKFSYVDREDMRKHGAEQNGCDEARRAAL